MAEGDLELGHVDIDEARNRSRQLPGSIYMVPGVIRNLSPSSFTPRVIPIGPIHHEDEHLKGFEPQKATCVRHLCHNLLSGLNSNPEQIFEACVTKVSGSIHQIKACYVAMPAYPDSELAKMMATDACFILTFIYVHCITHSPLGLNNLLYPHIFHDMVLIENQIPFFVLQDIFDCTFLELDNTLSLADFISPIQKFCNMFKDSEMSRSNISFTHDHILGFLHKSYQHPFRNSSKLDTMVKSHSVVEYERSGVRFTNNFDAEWRMAMELQLSRFLCFPLSWSNPSLKMPVLHLQDITESVLRNLIIYEHSSGLGTCITSYMQALDMLIDTPEDVGKLVKSQVIFNYLGSNEEAAGVINNVLKEIPFEDFYYQNEWKQLNEYYNAYWPNLIAELRGKYFSNPWSIIALIAGIVLFVLTVIQTIYAVKAVQDSKAA
ncbi:hypothetical protein CTI12_AA186270 [Artemisia annua]|uniref:Uncharacterized protein n=1 Tax=Artemisia annua TaxID=35608 RepID=A0A2U1P6V7_ARTAN|nr:hypothetical protein CTI12_AA186270 [Artemisia annua]